MRILLSFRDAYKLNALKHDVTGPEHRLSVPIFELIVYKNLRAPPIAGFWIYNESCDTLHDIYVLSVLQNSYCFFRGMTAVGKPTNKNKTNLHTTKTETITEIR